MRTVDDLVSIALAGGGLTLNAADLTVDAMIRIATAASGGTHTAQIHIHNTGHLSTADMEDIGRVGRGCVIFDHP